MDTTSNPDAERVVSFSSQDSRLPHQHDPQVFLVQLLMRLCMVRVMRYTAYRTNILALRIAEMTDALGAEVGVDLIDFLALIDRAVGALGLANIAVDAFIRDH